MPHGPLATPCPKCGWFHRRTVEQVRAEREAARAAKIQERKRKQTYAVRRGSLGYRYSTFKAQAMRRGKKVALACDDYARLVRQSCLYCGSTEHIGVDRARNDEHYTRENAVPCCASCNFMKGTLQIREFAKRARRINMRLETLTRSQSAP